MKKAQLLRCWPKAAEVGDLSVCAPRKMKAPGVKRGHLKLLIDVSAEKELQVTVVQGRQLSPTSAPVADTFVQVCLCPREDDTTSRWSTQTVTASNSPVYNQTYTQKLSSRDEHKRLRIDVWHRKQTAHSNEFLGCMSFGLRHLVANAKKKCPVSGWYHLLSEDLGHRKHLLAQSCSPRSPATPSAVRVQQETREAPDTGRKLAGKDRLTVTVPRSSSGYGFTVKTTRPVRVGRVRAEGSAAVAGLLKGDYILTVNGQDVTGETAPHVANVVRKSKHALVLEICRKHQSKDQEANKENLFARHIANDVIIATSARENLLRDSAMDVSKQDDSSDVENIPPRRNSSLDQSDSGYSKSNSYCDSKHDASSLLYINSSFQLASDSQAPSSAAKSDKVKRSYRRWVPDISSISPTDSASRHHVTAYDDTIKSHDRAIFGESLTSWYEWLETSSKNEAYYLTDSSGCGTDISSVSPGTQAPHCSLSSVTKAHHSSLASSRAPHSSLVSSRTPHSSLSVNSCDNLQMSSGDDHLESDESVLPESTASMSGLESLDESSFQARVSAIHALMVCERDFIASMQRGIQQFSRPLRHCLLSTDQHQALFQNVEKLVALSEFHYRQLTPDGDEDSFLDSQRDLDDLNIGQIYSQRIRLVCEAYRTYIEGLGSALGLLDQLREQMTFSSFLKDTAHCGLSIEAYLRQPQRHLVELFRRITAVYHVTPRHHDDWMCLYNLLQGTACL